MRASFKERSFVLLWLVTFVLVVSSLAYMAFAKPKSSGMLTSGVRIVEKDNLEQIELYKKYQSYAFKVKDNNKFYLRYYSMENKAPVESKFELTSEQYNKLVEGNEYWFMVKFSKNGDTNSGTIKEILSENPARR